jgi:hypothetical protein
VMPGPGVDMVAGMVMVEGMDSMEVSTEGMVFMGITDSMEGMVSTMVSMGIMDFTAILVEEGYLVPALMGDITLLPTPYHPSTLSRNTGITAPTPRGTMPISRAARTLGCESSHEVPPDSEQGLSWRDLGRGHFSSPCCSGVV